MVKLNSFNFGNWIWWNRISKTTKQKTLALGARSAPSAKIFCFAGIIIGWWKDTSIEESPTDDSQSTGTIKNIEPDVTEQDFFDHPLSSISSHFNYMNSTEGFLYIMNSQEKPPSTFGKRMVYKVPLDKGIFPSSNYYYIKALNFSALLTQRATS